jgi:hypothetical protein
MPYSIDHKSKCVYKKKSDGSRGEKVGCTKGSLKDYVAALQIHAENKKPMKKQTDCNEHKAHSQSKHRFY